MAAKKNNLTSKKLKLSVLIILISLMLSCFFWLPSLVEGSRYTRRGAVFDNNKSYSKAYLTLEQLFYSPWRYEGHASINERHKFSVAIGNSYWFIFGLTAGVIILKWKKRKNNPNYWFLLFNFCLFAITVFLMLKQSKFLLNWLPLGFLQFPFRLLNLTLISSSILGAILCSFLKRKTQVKFIIILGALIIMSAKSYWHIGEINNKMSPFDNYWANEFTETGDRGEHTPIWSPTRYLEKAPAKVQVADGNVGKIEITKWQSEIHEYLVEANTPSRLAESTSYFPGWKVYIDNKKVLIEFQDPFWPGMITYKIPSGQHKIRVVFTETKLRIIADFISILGIVMTGSLIYLSKKRQLY